jgi:hypothetical protein
MHSTRVAGKIRLMSIGELMQWQWQGYERYHRSRFNLLLHIVAVPIFVGANLALAIALTQGHWLLALCMGATMVVSIAVQGRGHGREPTPPVPFTGPANAIARIFLEQWLTFPRWVLTGGWVRAWRMSETQRGQT